MSVRSKKIKLQIRQLHHRLNPATIYYSEGILTYQADSGENNQVVVTETSGVISIGDVGASTFTIDPSATSIAAVSVGLSGPRVVFSSSVVTQLSVLLGDLDDSAVIQNSVSVVAHVNGGTDDDAITGHNSTNTLQGGSGNDLVYGGSQTDVIEGGDDNDHLMGGDKDDTIMGGLGVDIIDGEDGNNLMLGYNNDLMNQNDFALDDIYADNGDDTFVGDMLDILDISAGGIDTVTRV